MTGKELWEALRYPASFVAFDCIYIEGKELIWTPLMDRKEQLSRLVNEDREYRCPDMWKVRGLRFIWRQRRANWKALLQKEKTAFI